jgi:hypothetical protein
MPLGLGFAPFVETGPSTEVFTKGVETLLYLTPDGPVAMAAVAVCVDARGFMAPDAFLPVFVHLCSFRSLLPGAVEDVAVQ